MTQFDPKTTEIEVRTEKMRFSISRDYDDDPEETHPVLLHVLNVDEPGHDHIELTRAGAETLYDWLGKYLGKETGK